MKGIDFEGLQQWSQGLNKDSVFGELIFLGMPGVKYDSEFYPLLLS